MSTGSFAEKVHEIVEISCSDILDVGDPTLAQLFGSNRTNAPQSLNGKRMQELELSARFDDKQAIGFAHRARNLGQKLGGCAADADRNADFGKYPLA